MPNLNPVPDSLPHLKEEEDLIAAAGGLVDILPYAALTVGEKEKKQRRWRSWRPGWLPSPTTARASRARA